MLDVTTLLRIADERGFYVEWAQGYSEPGYTAGDQGIVLANWNNATRYDSNTGEHTTIDGTPERMARMFEAAGCEIEWSDEWATCDDCSRIVRTSADSYGWTPSYAWIGDCSIVCAECLPDDPSEYIEQLKDSASSADTMGIIHALDGWHEVSANNETGFHPGQDDDPSAVLSQLHEAGLSGIVCSVDSAGQFDASWSAWAHEDDIPDAYWDKHMASV